STTIRNKNGKETGSDGEGRTTATGAGGIRIADDETRTHQAAFIIDLRAGQVLDAHGIHQQRDITVVDQGVIILDAFVKGKAIGKPRTTTAGDINTQLEIRIAFFVAQFADLGGSTICQRNDGFTHGYRQ